MKISGYKVVEETAVQLIFKNGGAMIMPLTRIERILDDEIVEMAAQYESGVQAIQSNGDAAAKKVKEKAFDAVRAPAAGW